MKDGFVLHLVYMLQAIGSVSSRRMFGGHGIFLEGVMFGLVADNTFFLKVDAYNINDFKVMGMEAFTYYKKDKPSKMSYYQAPLEVFEDIDEMVSWANSGYAAALRAAAKRKPQVNR